MSSWREFFKYLAFLVLVLLLRITMKYDAWWLGLIAGVDIFCIWQLLRSDKN